MVTIGNTTLPGVQTTVRSARTVGVDVESPGEVGFVGEANLEVGTANPNEVYRITNTNRAETWFGVDSPLTQVCIDALREGAYPVYAVAPAEETETEDLVEGPTTSEFDTSPVTEIPDRLNFEDVGGDTTVNVVYEDVGERDPENNEVYVNPVEGEYNVGSASTSEDSVQYTAFDWDSAIDVMAEERGDRIDFFTSATENREVVDYVEDAVNRMENRYEFAITIAGATTHVDATEDYENPYDNSRVQLIYPSRNRDGESIIGSYAGLRSALGMSSSPIRKQLNNQRRLYHRVDDIDMGNLINENVIPIASRSSGSRIIDDVTTVRDDNLDEQEMQQGISRIVVDFVTLLVQRNADAFIGELHKVSTRNTLKEVLKSELRDLADQDAILGYSVTVEKVDAMTAEVNVGIETVKPLRNIVANVTAGNVE